MRDIKRCFVFCIGSILLNLLGGCTSYIHDQVVDSYPTFTETQSSWSSIPEGKGRLLIFWPRLPMMGFNPNPLCLVAGCVGGYISSRIDIDGKVESKGRIGDETFVFVDLDPGVHKVRMLSNRKKW